MSTKTDYSQLLKELQLTDGAKKFKKSLKNDQDSDDDEPFGDEEDGGQMDIEALDAMEDQNDKMNWFVNEFGVNIDIPAFYVQDAKVVPHDPSYCLMVVSYVIPQDPVYLRTHKDKKGKPKVPAIRKLQEEKYFDHPRFKGASLKLMQKKDASFVETGKEVHFKRGKKVTIEFSPDGQYLAVLQKKINILDIWKIGDDADIEDYLDKMSHHYHNCELHGEQNEDNIKPHIQFMGDKELFRTKYLEFDQQSRYLMCYGPQQVNIINLNNQYSGEEEEEEQIAGKIERKFKLNTDFFNTIKDVQFVSTGDEAGQVSYQCEVACRMKEHKVIVIFDIDEDQTKILTKKNYTKSIAYLHEDDQSMKVKISEDFSQVVLVNKSENYILELEKVEQDDDDEEDSNDTQVYHQRVMGWLKGKCVKKIEKQQYLNYQNEWASRFYFICCKDYDQDLAFMRSDDENFKVIVARQIEPGVINVFDVHIYQDKKTNEETNEETSEEKLICLSLRDEDFFIDTVNTTERVMQKFFVFSKFRAVSSNWPYIAFQGIEYNEDSHFQDNYVWLLNAYHPQIINRIQMPKYLVQICFTYMCENYDLYVVGETAKTYELYHIDLNAYEDMQDKNELNRLFNYTILAKIDKVQRQQDLDDENQLIHELRNNLLLGFHVKSQQADDDDENASEKITILLLYQKDDSDPDSQNSIWIWQLGFENRIEWVCDTKTTKMTRLNDETVIFREDQIEYRPIEQKQQTEGSEEDSQNELGTEQREIIVKNDFVIKQIKIEVDFNSYSVDEIYSQNQLGLGGLVKAYAYDYHREVVITLQVTGKKKGKKQQKICRIFDIRNQKLLWQQKIRNQTLIGRLKSSLYTLVDGHIYYNNDLIKVRYDLLEQKNSKDLEEDQIFDYYENVFNLEDHEAFYTKMPICSLRFHRMVYVTKNRKQLTNSKVLMIPFLHERKIYLNRNNDDEKYFYTTIRVPSEDLKTLTTLFVTMCISSSKYYVYNMKGIQKSRVDFKKYVQEFGELKAVSQNGQVFVLKKTKKVNKVKMWQLTIFVLTLDEFIKIKTFTVQDAILKYLSDVQKESSDVLDKEISNVMGDLYDTQIMQKKDKYNIKIQINNNLDVAVEMYQKKDYKGVSSQFQEGDEKRFTESVKPDQIQALLRSKMMDVQNHVGSLIYFQKGSIGYDSKNDKNNELLEDMGIDIEKFLEDDKPLKDKQKCFFTMKKEKRNPNDPNENEEVITVDKNSITYQHFSEIADKFEKGLYGYALSNDYIFFWNDTKIFFLKFNEEPEYTTVKMEENQHLRLHFHQLMLRVDQNELQTRIKKVMTGSDSKSVVIHIQQSASSDCYMGWDVENNREFEAFDLQKDSGKVFFDALGKAYITEQDKHTGLNKVYIMEQGLALTCYDVENINRQTKEEVKQTQVFGYHYGNRFDSFGHSWLYLRDYISTSYSYMTFVIKRKIHDEDNDYQQDDYQFDIEQYNYIINCKTALTDDDNLIKDNTELLDFILKNFEQADKVLLEQIQYYHYEKVNTNNNDVGASSVVSFNPNLEKRDQKKHLFQSSVRDKGAGVRYKMMTPLHIAHQYHNNRSTKTLLKYMAKIDYNAMHHYRDIIHELVDVNGFTDYLWELPFQSLQMQNKQNLRVSDPYNEQIVAVKHSITSYVDNEYYRRFFHEDKENLNYKKYPVKITALQIQWINDIVAGQEKEDTDGKRFLDALLKSENIDIFGIPAINMIIEFLYEHYRSASIKEVLIWYLVQFALYFGTIWINEGEFEVVHSVQNVEGGTKTYVQLHRQEKNEFWLILVATASMLVSFKILWEQVYYTFKLDGLTKLIERKPVFFDDVVATDILFCIINIFITMCIYYFANVEEVDGEGEQGAQKWLRQLQMCAGLLYTYRILYFLKIVDQIAPLVYIVKQVLIDITYFVVVMFFILAAFANAFYLIGRNQVIFDNIEEGDEPLYSVFSGTIQYIYLLCLGEIGADDANFSKGDQSQFYIGWALFILATFIILVTMMNMLIAIMGTTFERNMEVEEQNLAREHLKFVVNHWYLNPLEKDEFKGKINYLIVAFLEEDVEENVEILNELYEDMTTMRKQHDKDMNDIKDALKIIKNAQV